MTTGNTGPPMVSFAILVIVILTGAYIFGYIEYNLDYPGTPINATVLKIEPTEYSDTFTIIWQYNDTEYSETVSNNALEEYSIGNTYPVKFNEEEILCKYHSFLIVAW